MGVPGFFAWLINNKYGKIKLIKNMIMTKIKWLMLDTNCLLHPCVANIIEKYNNNELELDNSRNIREQIEELIWNKITSYIDNIIEEVNPEYIYIGIDGVPPMGKIIQQRQRRYKYLYDTEIKLNKIIKEIKTENIENIEEPIIPISSIELTPGTNYMERIHKKMLDYVEILNERGIKYVYSSYHDEGEGEHKILQYIKKNIDETESIVIYGLDADLLFLSLGINRNELYVMREQQIFINKEINYDEKATFNYVKIKDIQKLIEKCDINTNDFIILCYLIGNDFLPKILTLDVKKGGLNKILEAYKDIKKEFNNEITIVYWEEIKNKYSINWDILLLIFKKLSWTEKNIWNYINKNTISNKTINDFISGKTNEIKMLEKKEFNTSTEYYNHYLGINNIKTNKKIIKNMVINYIEGIEWCINYYLNDCPNWIWGYNYIIAPLIKDIITLYPKNIEIKNAKRTLNPVESLILAIPPLTYKYVIEKEILNKINDNIKMGYMFPYKFNIDINKEELYWKCSVMIPIVEYYEYNKEIKKINIENEKNKIYGYIKNF